MIARSLLAEEGHHDYTLTHSPQLLTGAVWREGGLNLGHRLIDCGLIP